MFDRLRYENRPLAERFYSEADSESFRGTVETVRRTPITLSVPSNYPIHPCNRQRWRFDHIDVR